MTVLFDECKLFRDVAQARSLSRAAQMNGISQPAASQQIQELERRMGVILLDRSRRPLGLTEAGRMYADLCRDVIRKAEDFTSSLENLRQAAEGVVRVASIYSIGLSDMPGLQKEFAAVHPESRIEVELLKPMKVYDAVESDRADLGFISYPEHRRELTVTPWRNERMTVAVYPGHRLEHRAVVTPADLEGERFVTFDEEVVIRRELDKFFRERGIDVKLAMQFDNIQSIKEAVALGSGISILPERSMKSQVEQKRLISIPLDAALVRPTAIIHRKRKKLNRAATQFLQLTAGVLR